MPAMKRSFRNRGGLPWWFWRSVARRRGGDIAPALLLSASIAPEDADIGDVIGALSVSSLPEGVTVSSYAVTADADDKFDIDVDELIVDGALDYETAIQHSVTIEATLSDASTIEREFTITVTNIAAPAQFGPSDWSVADDATSGDITITITSLPSSGSAITDLEYRLDAGSWVSLAGTGTGAYHISGLTDTQQYAVSIRAVSAEGNGTASATKNVTPTAPAGSWQTVYSKALTTNDSGWGDFTSRTIIPASALADIAGGTKVRVTVSGHSASASGILASYLGHAAGAGDAYDFDGNQVQMKLATNGAFTIPANADTLLDEANFTYDGTKNLIFAIAFGADGFARREAQTGASVQFKSGSDAATTNASGYAEAFANTVHFVFKIEVFAP